MGAKSRYISVLMLFINLTMLAQEMPDFKSADSLTYKYYRSAEWDKLIKAGEDAIRNGIDYKYLRQRLGYAFFIKGNYTEAKIHFEKALSFDSFDEFSLEYLYYTYIYTGNEDFSGVYARRLSEDVKKSLSVSQFRLVESLETEYNFKYAGTKYRSNPQYLRVGVNSSLGYRLSLYQSYSAYGQQITKMQNSGLFTFTDKQQEYYALLKWNISGHLLLKGAYHYLDIHSGDSALSGNLFLAGLSGNLRRSSFELRGSVLNINNVPTYQAGADYGYVFAGKSDFTLTASFSEVFKNDGYQFIYTQKAGLKLFKKCWMEGNISFGRMTDYNDFNGLYIYNSYDPMIFRTGATLTCYVSRKITLWANYSYEQKEYLGSRSSQTYNQFSYLGGIKWKL